MGTAAAAFPPLLAAELRTSAGESPVVMQSPDNGYVFLLEIFEEHGDVQIVVT